MKWIDLAVKSHFSWPNVQVEVPFEGKKVVLQPLTEDLSSTVSVFDDGGTTFDEGGSILSRFLSRLAWSMDGGVVELFVAGSNNSTRPGRLGRGTYGTSGWAAINPWGFLYLPAADSREADLALALFREGMSVNSAPFAFLSYFKVLNIAYSSGPKQKDWINNNLAHIWHQPAIDRLEELRKSESDLGAYLYHQGRCAVAHANGTPLVNPDNYGDKRRLELDLPLMKEVAATFIEKEFGVLSDSSFWERLRETNLESPELMKKTESRGGTVVYVALRSAA